MAVYDINGNAISAEPSKETFNELKYPNISVISAPNYPHHDATVVNGQIWAFNKPSDGDSKAYTLENDT